MSSTYPERGTAERATAEDPGRRGTQPTTSLRPFGLSESSTESAEEPEEATPVRTRHVVDRFDGAFALLVLRVVTALVLAIRGLQKVQHLDVTRQQFAELAIPYSDTMALVVGVGQVAIALALVVGIAVRVAGLGLAILAVGALVYGSWRTGDYFTAGVPGFNDELKLLLAAVGVTFLGLGGGGWTLDRRFRRR